VLHLRSRPDFAGPARCQFGWSVGGVARFGRPAVDAAVLLAWVLGDEVALLDVSLGAVGSSGGDAELAFEGVDPVGVVGEGVRAEEGGALVGVVDEVVAQRLLLVEFPALAVLVEDDPAALPVEPALVDRVVLGFVDVRAVGAGVE
jgi:hypothetical protein